MERQGRTPTWLARKIYCDRTNIHKIYKKDSIDTKLLFNISKALRHNFFCELAEFYQTQAENNFIDVAVENSLAEPDDEMYAVNENSGADEEQSSQQPE